MDPLWLLGSSCMLAMCVYPTFFDLAIQQLLHLFKTIQYNQWIMCLICRYVNKDSRLKDKDWSSRTEIKDFRLSRHISCNKHKSFNVRGVVSVNLHLNSKTDMSDCPQTDRHQKSNLVHFSLQMWHLVAILLMIFASQSTDQIACIYWLIPDFYPPPIKKNSMQQRAYRMDADDRHNEQTGVSLCSFVRLCLIWSLTLI